MNKRIKIDGLKNKSLRRTLTVTRKEFIHIKRDKPSLVISLLMPIIMLLIFGFAVNNDVNNVQYAVVDQSHSQISRELIDRFSNAHYFSISDQVGSIKELEDLIKKGSVKIGLIIPPDFSRSIKRGSATAVQILVDGSDPTIARTAASYAASIVNQFSLDTQIKIKMRTLQGTSPGASIKPSPLVLFNPTLESAKFNVPGVVGLILQNITIILTALAMVREKELGTIEQLVMTPIASLELIIGKLIPYILIGIYDFAAVLILSYWFFGITVAGNLYELIALGIVFLIGALAMGMLISTIAKNQAQAIQGTLAFLLPSVLLSGFMFPREAMPLFIQLISTLFPITHFLVILRGIIIKGVDVTYLWSSTLWMLALIVILIGATAAKFSKKLD